MGTFWGLVLLSVVVWYGLWRIRIALLGVLGLMEVSLNRAALHRGERPVSDDVDMHDVLR